MLSVKYIGRCSLVIATEKEAKAARLSGFWQSVGMFLLMLENV